MITEKEIWSALEIVKDPEIPTLSMVDMGIITKLVVLIAGAIITVMTFPGMRDKRRKGFKQITLTGRIALICIICSGLFGTLDVFSAEEKESKNEKREKRVRVKFDCPFPIHA